MRLPPATPPIEAAATKQKNDDYDDKKRGHVHGFSFLRQKRIPRHPSTVPWELNFAGRIFVAARGKREGQVLATEVWKAEEMGCRAFSLPVVENDEGSCTLRGNGNCSWRCLDGPEHRLPGGKGTQEELSHQVDNWFPPLPSARA